MLSILMSMGFRMTFSSIGQKRKWRYCVIFENLSNVIIFTWYSGHYHRPRHFHDTQVPGDVGTGPKAASRSEARLGTGGCHAPPGGVFGYSLPFTGTRSAPNSTREHSLHTGQISLHVCMGFIAINIRTYYAQYTYVLDTRVPCTVYAFLGYHVMYSYIPVMTHMSSLILTKCD